jgi:hypothetical protein
VGFSTIFVSMRQALGGQMSKYDLLLTRNILDLGLMVVIGAVLPALLAMLGVTQAPAARVAAAVTALPLLWFNARYPSKRRQATGKGTPDRVKLNLAMVYLVAALLLADAGGLPLGPPIAIHALGLTALLGSTFLAFMFGLQLLPKVESQPVEGVHGNEQEDGASEGPAQK